MVGNLRTAHRLALISLVMLLAASCCLAASAPKNVILIIGDGMGIGAITAARCVDCGPDGQLTLDKMPVTGLALTHAANSLVTDSAASGTALATGTKTNNGMIGQAPDGKRLRSILEAARDMGKSTAVVTTDALVGATPAAFYAHVASRNQGDDIAAQLIPSRVNVAFGAAPNAFVPKSGDKAGRKDGRDLLAEARKRGYDVVNNADEMKQAASDRVLGVFADGAMPPLEDMTSKAISVLSRNPRGFFVMVESCYPDKGGHANNGEIVVKGVLDLDAALRKALEFAEKDGQTLVLVTADHETGGLAVQNPSDKNPGYTPTWTGGGHTANMVAVYAFGPGSELFAGTLDNTRIPRTLATMWKAKLN